MGNTLGYMVTWTRYYTWLQGDERGVQAAVTCGNDKREIAAVAFGSFAMTYFRSRGK